MTGRSTTLRAVTFLASLAGLALFLGLVIHHGLDRLAAAVAATGWGLAGVAAFRLLTIVTDTLGWRRLFKPSSRPPLLPLVLYRWVGESMNNLLPVAQVGGDLERARLAARLTGSGTEAGATVLVDFTSGLLTQIIYAFLGVACLAALGGGGGSAAMVLGLAAAAVLMGTFYAVQRLGLFRRLAAATRRMVGGAGWRTLAGDAAALDRAIAEVYGRRRDFFIGAAWRLLSWILHTGETWIALRALGSAAGLPEALVLESLTAAARSAAFVVPGGLGVQDGAFLVFGERLGLSPELCLALALVKRARELLVGGPGIVAWMVLEGRGLGRWLGKRRGGKLRVDS